MKPFSGDLACRLLAGGVLIWMCTAPGPLAQSQDKGLPGALERIAAPKKEAPLFQSYFPHPTGANGLEEYAKAADLLSDPLFVDLMNWEAYRPSVLAVREVDTEEAARLQARIGDFKNTTLLDAQRKVLRTMPEVRELIRRGNAKPIIPIPRDRLGMPETRLQVAVKNLAKFLQRDAYVAFADGNSASGTDALAVGIEMVHHLPQDSLISRLIMVACNSIMLAETEKHLDRQSSKDVDRLMKVAEACLGQSARFTEAVRADFEISDLVTSEMRKVRSEEERVAFPGLFDLPEGTEALFKGMSQSQWLAFVDRIESAVNMRRRDFLTAVGRPEGAWFDELKAIRWDEEPSGVPKTLDEVARLCAIAETIVLKQAAQAEAKYRTQMRLLRLHCRVLKYKWNEGKLPARLEDAAPSEEIADPFGKGEFEYQPDPYGHYQLFSKGFEGIGRLDLRYRRDPNARIDPGDLPPR